MNNEHLFPKEVWCTQNTAYKEDVLSGVWQSAKYPKQVFHKDSVKYIKEDLFPKWYKPSEKLPQYNSLIVIAVKRFEQYPPTYTAAMYVEHAKRRFCYISADDGYDIEDVDFWMELSNPYKEDLQ